MPLLNWSETYRIGVAGIDCEHENLFRLLNALYETLLTGNTDDRQIEEVFYTVNALVRQHCAHEEKLLKKVQYPDYEDHCQQHRWFLKQSESYLSVSEHTRDEMLKFAKFVMEWMVRHTLDSDMLYRAFLIENNFTQVAKPEPGTQAALVEVNEKIRMAGRDLPTFYFDLAKMTRNASLRKEDRYRLMAVCHFYVSRIAPDELFIPMEDGFYFVVQTQKKAEAAKLAHSLHTELMKLLFCGTSPDETGAYAHNAVNDAKTAEVAEAENALRDVLKPIWQDIDFVEAVRDAKPPEQVDDGAFALKFKPVFDLRTGKPISYICGPALSEEGRSLFGRGITQHFDCQMRFEFDLRMLKLCLDFIGQGLLTDPKVRLGVRVNFETLAWSKMRNAYQDVLRAAQLNEKPHLGLLIDGIPAGTPCTRIAELATFVCPFVKQVSVHLPEQDTGMKWVGNMGVAGLSTHIPENMTNNEILRYAVWLKKTALAQNAVCIMQGETEQPLRDILRKIGIQYVVEPKAAALSVEDLPQAFVKPPMLADLSASGRTAAASVA